MNSIKKFINDNIVFLMLGAIVLGGLALYKVTKKNEEEKPTDKPTETTAG